MPLSNIPCQSPLKQLTLTRRVIKSQRIRESTRHKRTFCGAKGDYVVVSHTAIGHRDKC